MNNYIILGFIGVIIAAISQLILKVGATKKLNSNLVGYMLNMYTIFGYILMLVVTLVNLYIYKYLDLKYSLIFLPSTFLLVIIISSVVLKEKIKRNHLLSYFIIICGIILFNL